MKKITAFALSFLIAASVLSAAAYGVYKYKNVTDIAGEKIKSATDTQRKKDAALNAAVFYIDEENVFAAVLSFDLKSEKCRAIPIYSIDGTELKTCFSDFGFQPLLTACFKQSGISGEYYFKFDRKSFVKVADRSNNLVYNVGTAEERLLTGEQARQLLTPDNFAGFCAVIAEKSMQGSLSGEFLYFVRTVENNLSYPKFYDAALS